MDTLLTDLFKAYYDARRNKRNTPSQLRFEINLESNLIELYHELRERRYRPSPSVCFIVQDSVKREVFASDFRDRIIHHLYYNYVMPFFDRQFIYDSYSCRKGKGTLLGIERFQKHIRSVSHNYTHNAYVLKMDIQGYFMSINRKKLCDMVHEMTEKVKLPSTIKGLIDYLSDIIILKDPLHGAIIKGSPEEWDDLPPSKCLRYSPEGVGLPIGDLTSQLYSNIFLNKLDRYICMTLGFKHYGRYVDDFYIVDDDKNRLLAAVPQIEKMLNTFGLKLHKRKTKLYSVKEPVVFLGAVVYPYYRHCSARTNRKFSRRKYSFMQLIKQDGYNIDSLCKILDVQRCLSSMNSYYGYLRHFKTAIMRYSYR